MVHTYFIGIDEINDSQDLKDSMADALQLLRGYIINTTKENTMDKTLERAIDCVIDASGLEVPDVRQGIFISAHGTTVNTDPWKAHIGGLHVTAKSDPQRHLELALEHLVAAQTIPTLKKALDDELARQEEAAASKEEAEAKNKAIRDLYESDDAKEALEAFNNFAGTNYESWAERDEQVATGFSKPDVTWWIKEVQKKRAEKEAADAVYRATRREELAERFSFLGKHGFEMIGTAGRAAIDYIIDNELKEQAK